MTWYWTFDPDNADEGWDEWTKGAWPQDPVKLKGTDITVPRNMANKYNLEGSGWYTEGGGHTVINIIEPHVKPESTLFKQVDFVDYGLDAPHYHYGLVPFRTLAGVHDDIPAGTWVYIPMFDGIQVPVYDVDNRWNIDYSFWHDGWFRVSDISWSFADDATQIDIFAGTVQAVKDVYSQIWANFTQTEIWNETKQEYQTLDTYNGEVSYYYNADVPVYLSKDKKIHYRYAATKDTIHNDTRPAEYVISEERSEGIKALPIDLDNDSYRDDILLFNKSTNTLKGYVDCFEDGIRSPKWSQTLPSFEVYDIITADFSNSGDIGVVIATDKGIVGGTVTATAISFDTLSSEVGSSIAVGDFNNDNKNEVILLTSGGEFKKAEYEKWNKKLSAFVTLTGISSSSAITAITAGDITAEGQDELIYGNAEGVWAYNFTGKKVGLFSNDVTSPRDLLAVYADPDGFADIFAIDKGYLKAKYSSHKQGAPFVELEEAGGDWVSFASINPKEINKSYVISVINSIEKSLSQKNVLSIDGKKLTLPASSKAGALSVCSINGRLIASVLPHYISGKLQYDLSKLSVGTQPLIISVDIDGVKASKVMILK